ncbi:MAG: molybdenum cofactor guanylyltransferase [Pseudomonadota bacterium]
MKLLGVVLAGGQSCRMGRNKLFVELDGKRLIDHAVDRLSKQIPDIVVNAPNTDDLRDIECPIVADSLGGFQGPLAGILSGLQYATEHGFDGIITVAADTPFFPDNYVSQLSEVKDNIAIAATRADKLNLHPVFGLWPCDAAQTVKGALDADRRKVMWAAEIFGWKAVEFECSHIDPFFNINTPEDLRQAEQIIAHESIRN